MPPLETKVYRFLLKVISNTNNFRYISQYGSIANVVTQNTTRFDLQYKRTWSIEFNLSSNRVMCSNQHIYKVLSAVYGIDYLDANVMLLEFFNKLFKHEFSLVKRYDSDYY